MKSTYRQNLLAAAFVGALVFTATIAGAGDSLSSWNDGKAKQSIVDFVAKVTKAGLPDFVPVAERIAAFDNDGTLWAEQLVYFQAFFIFDRKSHIGQLNKSLDEAQANGWTVVDMKNDWKQIFPMDGK